MAEHKFFERYVDVSEDDLKDFYNFCIEFREKMINGEIPGVTKKMVEEYTGHALTTTMLEHYNIFQMKHKVIRRLYSSVRDMVKEACEYYGIDFNSQEYYIQGWVNVEDIDLCEKDQYESEDVPRNYHEHAGGYGMPDIHGYYCVNAEPSVTHYIVNGEEFKNINKNNRAILSETGHKHARGWWGDTKLKRVTLAYDTRIAGKISEEGYDQHWIPLI